MHGSFDVDAVSMRSKTKQKLHLGVAALAAGWLLLSANGARAQAFTFFAGERTLACVLRVPVPHVYVETALVARVSAGCAASARLTQVADQHDAKALLLCAAPQRLDEREQRRVTVMATSARVHDLVTHAVERKRQPAGEAAPSVLPDGLRGPRCGLRAAAATLCARRS